MTLTRQNLATGTTTVGSFGPLYVFDMTPGLPADRSARYQALFIYPSLAAYLAGESDSALLARIVDTVASPLIPIQATSTPALAP
jgi:hypothetical protein